MIAPNENEMIRGPHSDTPYYVLGPDTTGTAEPLTTLADDAFDRIAATGLDALVEAHAAVICLTGQRRPDQTLRSFAITRLPATVFTDHTGDAAVLGRDLVHEAAHNWLNDAHAALHVTIPDDVTYFSPWRGTERPAYGFLHACFAFPLTMIYAARALPDATSAGHAVLADHQRQQCPRLAAAQNDFTHALQLLPDRGLRERLDTVFQHARTLWTTAIPGTSRVRPRPHRAATPPGPLSTLSSRLCLSRRGDTGPEGCVITVVLSSSSSARYAARCSRCSRCSLV
ncbi:aKG-HExxH-type peptide beta-hydroxylase [Streptomyces sp. 061-3]|uniref:aKG-HExxH-type peptide beta-hydroxylase n=1 Tax=Streptomyces sp. 061-3 TaxID=2789268 RepID=UPI00397F507A